MRESQSADRLIEVIVMESKAVSIEKSAGITREHHAMDAEVNKWLVEVEEKELQQDKVIIELVTF